MGNSWSQQKEGTAKLSDSDSEDIVKECEECRRAASQYQQQKNELERKINELTAENVELQESKKARLAASQIQAESTKQMESHIQALMAENKELKQYKESQVGNSLSYQARKRHGDVAPGDITHGQVSINYKNFFKSYLRELPGSNSEIKPKQILQAALPTIYKELYEVCCKEVLDELLQNLLQEMFLVDPLIASDDKSDIRAQEKHADMAEACGLLIYHLKENKSKLNEIAERIKLKLSCQFQPTLANQQIKLPETFIEDAVDLSIQMLTLNPPQVMSTLPTAYDEDLHDKVKTPADEPIVDMVYFRPILFQGRYGAAVVHGQVGNSCKLE